MHLGFVSAIFPDLSLEDVPGFAADAGFDCVELPDPPLGCRAAVIALDKAAGIVYVVRTVYKV